MKKKSLSVKNKTHKQILKYLNNKEILKIYKEFDKSINIKGSFAVAVSGGPDSLALAFLSKCFSIINKLNIKYFIVNHNLRKNSLEEANKVYSILSSFDIKCMILNWKGAKPKSNIQALARNKRYSLIIKECKKIKINQLLVGHHKDDLYENFLIRLLRGSGLKGLTSFGKSTTYNDNNFNIIRPLIGIEKKDLQLLSNKVFNFFVKDPSNLDEKFKRIRVRNFMNVLKKEGLDFKKFQLTIDNLKDSNYTINFYVKKNLKENSLFLKKNNLTILSSYFFDQPHEVVFRSLSSLIKKIGKKHYDTRGKSIDKLIHMINVKNFNKVTLGYCCVEKINQSVIITREKLTKN